MAKRTINKKEVGVVSGNKLLPESELVQYSGGYAVPAKDKYQPGIVTLIGAPAPVASDCPLDRLDDEWWSARGFEKAPEGYTGDNPARSLRDRSNWMRCLKEQEKRPDGGRRWDEPKKDMLLGEL